MVDSDTPGWDAIDTALRSVYADTEPQHYGTVIKWALGGPDPLDGISVYAREDHWHYVTYGMTELYDKYSDDAEHSGWGFEFTFRLARTPDEAEPEIWAANFLQNLARYVFSTGNSFGPGHHMWLNGPISLSHEDTAIRAITFAADPELGEVDSPHGRVMFLQVVGLTPEEYAAIERWNAESLLEVLAPRLPLLVTDLARPSLTDDPAVAAAIAEGSARDGSSTGSLFVQEAGWQLTDKGAEITLGANAAERVARVMTGRLPFGWGMGIDAAETSLSLVPGEAFAADEVAEGLLELTLPADAITELTAVLRPVAGTFTLVTAPELTVHIVKSYIRDQEGNVVAEIG